MPSPRPTASLPPRMRTRKVDDGLHRFAQADHAGCQRIARDVIAEALEQRGDPIQRQAIGELRDDEPRQRRFSGQSLRNDARAGRRDLQALVAARTGTLRALVPDHPNLLRDDFQLLADLDADQTVVGSLAASAPHVRTPVWVPANRMTLLAR